jgi:hypothetical protein
MTRETAINVLLGVTLISAVALPFLALALAFHGLDLALTHFFPKIKDSTNLLVDIGFFLGLLTTGTQQLRKRLWTNAFLSLSAAAIILLLWLLSSQPPFSGMSSVGFVAVFIVLNFTRIPSRAEFIGAATMIALSFAAQTGLLGSGSLSVFVKTCVYLAACAWILILARSDNPGWLGGGSIPSLTADRPTTGSPS